MTYLVLISWSFHVPCYTRDYEWLPVHCGDQRHLGLFFYYVPALACGSCRVSDQGTTLRALDFHKTWATILNPFNKVRVIGPMTVDSPSALTCNAKRVSMSRWGFYLCLSSSKVVNKSPFNVTTLGHRMLFTPTPRSVLSPCGDTKVICCVEPADLGKMGVHSLFYSKNMKICIATLVMLTFLWKLWVLLHVIKGLLYW